MSDVLVYSGPGVSSSALHHTIKTLRTLLTTYDVKTVDARTLALDPWQKGTALVVLPGGRDLPYVSELSRAYAREASSSTRVASEEVRNYVEAGGSFLGICAGAYYASGHCSFEKGTSMEVNGARPALRFFPGTCQGTVYPGFVYESDKGARIVDVDRTGEGDQWRCHYNGGGAFMDADSFKGQGVEVLARYAQTQPEELRLEIDLNSHNAEGSRRPDYAGQAAVVLSSVGLGKALLFGTHPEFPLLPTSTPVLLAENGAQEDKDREERDRLLRTHEQRRLQWLHELFVKRLGLRSELPDWAAPSAAAAIAGDAKAGASSTAVETAEPKLLPIFLASIGADDGVTEKILQKLAEEKASGPVAHIDGFEAFSGLKAAQVASVKDSNDAMHFAHADKQSIAEAQALCVSADYDAFSRPILSTTPAEGEAESIADKEVDLDSVPKYILACKDQRPTPDVLPYWNIDEYEKHLVHFRSVNLENEQNKAPGHWSNWKAPFDPFNPFGSSSSSSHTSQHRFGTPMLYTQMVTSTQTMLDKNFRLLSALPVGTTFFATQQMSGRGRGGNRWISPKGCLQFSSVFRVPVSMASKTVFLQYLSGLAVVEGVRLALGDSDAGRSVAGKVRIKWPNDIYAEIPPVDAATADGERAKTATFELGGKRYAKLGGILVNSQFSGGSEFVLISGCGVNCLNPRPTTSVSDLISIYNAAAGPGEQLEQITQEKLAGAILSTFDSIWKTFMQHNGDFRPFVDRYRQVWLHSDQQTTLTSDAIRTGATAGGGEQEESVRIVGISSDYGLLQAVPRTANVWSKDQKAWGDTEDATGSGIIQLQPDGNSFDMLQNLVKRKV